MPDGSPLRVATADAAAPLVFLAALARARGRVPGGLEGTARDAHLAVHNT